jgi:hypothetical protein
LDLPEQVAFRPERDDFSAPIKTLLSKRTGSLCSNPECQQPTSGPQMDPNKAINIGVASHITAAAPGGPRYDPSLTPTQRSSAENGIWLCQNCGKLVDNDAVYYPVEKLRAWKGSAEERARRRLETRVPAETAPAVAAAGGEHLDRVSQAVSAETVLDSVEEVIVNWSGRAEGKPIIDLRLVCLDDKGAETHEMQKSDGLKALLVNGQRVIVEAPAGRGKTTTLIQLARMLRASGRIPCLVNLPSWVRRNVGIFDFLANSPEFQSHGISAIDLARFFNKAQPFVFLLNGWNELLPSESTNGARLIRDLGRSFPSAGIAIATRTHPVTPPLEHSRRFKIQPLTRVEREAYLHGRLGPVAEDLIRQLNDDQVLNDLTRTPLILAEVASLFEAGRAIPASKLGVLDAVTRLMEDSAGHQAELADDPLYGTARSYLEELGSRLVASGGVQITDIDARQVVSSVSRALHDSGQIGDAPNPGAVLTALCSHHVLEPSSYPDVSYTFFHQQFQELFGALRLKHELAAIVHTGNGDAEFSAKYVNEPAWSEPVYMLAEFIGHNTGDQALPNAVAMGTKLVGMALSLDPIFAAELARLCGAEVWATVRDHVGARLRHLYSSQNGVLRKVGLAAMIASGSEDFRDVLVPLLSSADQSVRLETYRTWEPLMLSSLGDAWEETVRQWDESARINFVSHNIRRVPLQGAILDFALSDPSPAVRTSFLSNIWWSMSSDGVARFSQSLDDHQFAELISHVPTNYLPSSLRPRVVEIYRRIAAGSTDRRQRYSAWSRTAEVGDEEAVDNLKNELTEMDNELIGKLEQHSLPPIIDLIEKTDPAWVSDWVTRHLLTGVLRSESWIRRVKKLPERLRDELVERVIALDSPKATMPGVIPLLRQFADGEIVGRLFHRLCELRPIIAMSRPGDDKRSEADSARSMEDILRNMPPNVVVERILQDVGGAAEAVEIHVIVDIFHVAGRSDSPLREGLSAELREVFQGYLKASMPTTLTMEDPHGTVKAHFATVLAQIGDASDLPEIEQLIRTDLERFRAERAAKIAAATQGRRGGVR